MQKIIIALFALFVIAGTAYAQPAPPAPAGKVNVHDTTVAPAAASKVHVAPLPPAAGYVVTRDGSEDVNIVLRSDCPSGTCPGASASPPPAPAPATTPAPAPEPEVCTLGTCFFTKVVSYIGATGVWILEGLIVLAILGGAFYFFFSWLPEHFRHDRKWHRRAGRLHARWRAAARRSAANAGDMDLVEATEVAWGRYIGHTMQAGLSTVADYDSDDVELPPPPPAFER